MDKTTDAQFEYWRNETVAFLALTSIKGVSYWTLRKIAESKIGFKEILKSADVNRLAGFLRVALPNEDEWEIMQQNLWNDGIEKARELSKKGIKLVFFEHESFPKSLKEIPDPPYWIFVEGLLENLTSKSIAIVGTRKPTDDGIFITKLVISSIVDREFVTVSGLASGIDQIAHIESLRYGIPTVAVLGNGIFNEYPKGSNLLRKQIVEHGGTIITEYLPRQSYSAENFVRRNRLQAALCQVLVPAEWKIKSGTAHTVDYAYNYGKKIVNLYLPLTYPDRPELDFSAKNRNAKNYEIPNELVAAIDYIVSNNKVDNLKPTQQTLDL
ncbi:DNA-processing protein DprA [Pluralibacter gergoviae]|uniref:DNA-processing protein DprA n=1 Tax=Pluralibacter gergoviae TaxID=61647 RepID=UPI00155F333D|nr:DNA-processing protein DprA [Pluralibacter gergoviae]